MDPYDFFEHLVRMILPFLPVLFGAVEFLKSFLKIEDLKVTLLAMLLFVIYGALVIVSYFFPSWATYILGGSMFLLACALAPSGFYKFVSARTSKNS